MKSVRNSSCGQVLEKSRKDAIDLIATSNLALEIFILEASKEVLQYRYATDLENDKAIERVLEKKLHSTFRKNFLNGKACAELIKTSDVQRKFDAARNYRAENNTLLDFKNGQETNLQYNMTAHQDCPSGPATDKLRFNSESKLGEDP